MDDKKLLIPLNGLAAGESRFSWHAGGEFFDSFENAEISDADLEVAAVVEKRGRKVLVDCSVEGKVTVECDRCLEDLDMPIDVDIALDVRFGEGEDAEDDGREIVFVEADGQELDLDQIVYDYVCLSLPMQRTHRPGECNPDAVRHLGIQSDGDGFSADDEVGNPFSALKGLFKAE
ncbi:MAG: YceD family protein [Candidatus Cryptobacteroides sp.]